jgi:hypothetical protein
MRRIPVIPGGVASVLVLAVLCGCSGGSAGSAPKTSPSPTYPLGPRAVRLHEIPLTGHTVKDGFLAFTPIGFRTNMPYIIGSHAEFDAQGTFARVRIVVENTDRSTRGFDYAKQRLVTADGKTYKPDLQATLIERQPQTIEVGAGVRIEFDLLWDIPKNAKVKAVRLAGDPPSTQGVEVALPG